MNKNRNILWLYLFLIVGILDILFTANGQMEYRYFTKPLIIIMLWAYFFFSSKEASGSLLRKAISAALIFSWMGMFCFYSPIYSFMDWALF
jgi:hypothetical protein